MPAQRLVRASVLIATSLAVSLGACQTHVINGRASAGSVGSSGGAAASSSGGVSSSSAVSTGATGTGGSTSGTSAKTSGATGATGATASTSSSGTTTGPCPAGQGLFLGGCVPNEVCGPDSIWDGDICVALDCADNARTTCLTADGGLGECASGTCLDLEHDPQNCGSYGFVCPSPNLCLDGSCVTAENFPVCDPPYAEIFVGGPAGFDRECLLTSCTPDADNQGCGTDGGLAGFCCHGNCIPGDSDNCGGCGISCGEGSVCAGPRAGCAPALDCASAPVNALCQLPGGATGSCCDGACVDLSSDSANCGRCGQTAVRGGGCVAGAPTGSCAHDGDCPSGTGCAYGEACLQRACPAGSDTAECVIGEGPNATHGTCCGGTCVVDIFCGPTCNLCTAGTACVGSICVPLGGCGVDGGGPLACATDAGTAGSCCDGTCVDLSADPMNCAECGAACALGATCDGDVCSAFCPNQPCAAGDECVDGKCYAETCAMSGVSCAAGGQLGGCCGEQCVVPFPEISTTLTCGAVCPAGSFGAPECSVPDSGASPCGRAGTGPCPPGDACESDLCLPILDCSPDVTAPGGACLVGPGETGMCCGGSCVDPTSDPRNCGACGIVCASGICTSPERGDQGSCLPAAPTGDCAQTCGPGTACADGICVGSGCSWQSMAGPAPPPELYCVAEDGTLGECCQDGACAHLRDDPQNCGSCGIACAPGQACVAGTCAGSCPAARMHDFCNPDGGPSWVCCPSVGCTDLLWDANNCADCGTRCPAGQSCDAGWCG